MHARSDAAGPDVIYQGAFIVGKLARIRGFPEAVEGASSLGPTTTSRWTRSLRKRQTEASHPARGLRRTLGGDRGGRRNDCTSSWGPVRRFRCVRPTFATTLLMLGAAMSPSWAPYRRSPRGYPAAHATCRWRERCEGEWDAVNHLSLVARIPAARSKSSTRLASRPWRNSLPRRPTLEYRAFSPQRSRNCGARPACRA